MKAIRIILMIGFVVAATMLSWFSVSAALVAVSTTMLCVLYGKLDLIIEVSFGPLKAKLERNISESDRLLQALKKFASVQAKATASAAAHTGRFATGNDWIFLATKELEAALREIGATEDDLSHVRSDLVRLTLRDLGAAATGGSMIPSKLGKIAVEEWRQLRGDGEANDPDAIEAWLIKWDALTDDRQLLLEDMRWIIANRNVRDRDQYLRAQEAIPI